MSEKCGAVGALTVGGRVVGRIACELEAGHDVEAIVGLGELIPGGYRPPAEWVTSLRRRYPASPHAVTLTWEPETDPDLDLFDADEHFDVDVPIEPDIEPASNPRPRCEARGWGLQCRYEAGHDGPHNVNLDELGEW